MVYKTVKDEAEASFIEKKSKFTGYISPCATEDEAIGFIKKIRSMNRKANHNCYAYSIRENNISRHSDDGEPEGTAGVPIYEVIQKTGLSDVCIVVTRYFGGILLGAGGLVRAYSKAASLAVSAARVCCFMPAVRMKISCGYPLYGKISAAFAKYDYLRGTNTIFTDKAEITLYLPENEEKNFKGDMTELSAGKAEIETEAHEMFDFGSGI